MRHSHPASSSRFRKLFSRRPDHALPSRSGTNANEANVPRERKCSAPLRPMTSSSFTNIERLCRRLAISGVGQDISTVGVSDFASAAAVSLLAKAM